MTQTIKTRNDVLYDERRVQEALERDRRNTQLRYARVMAEQKVVDYTKKKVIYPILKQIASVKYGVNWF